MDEAVPDPRAEVPPAGPEAWESESLAGSASVARVAVVALTRIGAGELVEGLLGAVRAEMLADSAAILLSAGDGNLEVLACVGEGGEEVVGSRRGPNGCVPAAQLEVLEGRSLVVSGDEALRWHSAPGGTRALLLVPLRMAGAVRGALQVGARRAGAFRRADLPVLKAMAEVVGAALARSELASAEGLELYRSEREARLQAERTSETRTQFLGVISHELRTPLTAVLGYVELLGEQISGSLNEKQQQHVSRLRASALHLVGIIDQILTFARTETGNEPVNPERFDLVRLARETLLLLEPAAADRRIVLRTTVPDEPAWIVSDPGKVRQILLNLLGNAVKFMDDSGGDVEVRVLREYAGWARIEVLDSGPGIDPADHERIFEPFVRLDDGKTGGRGGSGLGLSVSRRLAELIGGRLTVESTPGKGSAFLLRLPAEMRAS